MKAALKSLKDSSTAKLLSVELSKPNPKQRISYAIQDFVSTLPWYSYGSYSVTGQERPPMEEMNEKEDMIYLPVLSFLKACFTKLGNSRQFYN